MYTRVTMSKTPASAALSSSLKERLKKCGRYHASPEPVARQPKILATTLDKEKTDNNVHFRQEPVLPNVKRQCLEGRSNNVNSYNELTSNHDNQSPLLTKRHTQSNLYSIDSEERKEIDNTVTKCSTVTETYRLNNQQLDTRYSTANCSLNQTPISQRSRSSSLKVKVNKLNFEEASIEDNDQENSGSISKTKYSMEDSSQISNENLIKSDLELPPVLKRNLMKELESKEEQLRKLRMVKMYRSKNNLEELQTLIDKWRAVSQQALQDLHAAMPEPRPTLTELINHLGIDHELLHFNAEEDETFF
ncbi:swi5-dependent recombination DNA repair protein 1 homolog [Ruditapes philippinarum]|uniref:swi5-dependent recombination DNA repair protein 1 homolog n=1 Tax=Ruditapes philippinarum TaxID=129788 RepID=UPI00295AE6F9|nr:swi5-dependent recombination DNA repair protein 1 homolog [Ruditapes philippinarum]